MVTMEYRRAKIQGISYFFTISPANQKSTLLIDETAKKSVGE